LGRVEDDGENGGGRSKFDKADELCDDDSNGEGSKKVLFPYFCTTFSSFLCVVDNKKNLNENNKNEMRED
jgi:hypothetical protein